jgi:hypothetical protein
MFSAEMVVVNPPAGLLSVHSNWIMTTFPSVLRYGVCVQDPAAHDNDAVSNMHIATMMLARRFLILSS